MDDAPADLPEEARQALVRLLEDVPDEDVLEFGRGRPALLKGLRAVAANAGVLRDRVRAELAHGRQLEPSLRALLALNSLQQSFVVVLSEEALRVGLPDFTTWLGGAPFAAALLLDERPGVRELGLEYFRGAAAGAAPPTADERAQAAHRLVEMFGPFLAHVAGLGAPATAAQAAPDRDLQRESRRVAAELHELRAELQRAQGLAVRTEKATSRELEKLRGDKAALELELGAAKERARAAAEEHRKVAREVAELRQQLDRLVNERLEAELSARLRPWLEPVRSLDEAVQAAAAGEREPADVLVRADAALRRQADVDRHSGNRAELQRRLAALEAMRANVDEARREALNPLPELEGLVSQLEREARSLRARLELPDAPCGLEETLVRINALGTLDALDEFRRFLDTAADLKAWKPGDQRLLYEKLDQQFSRVMESHLVRDHKPAPPLAPLAALRQALARDDEFLLLVDGHNVLPDFFAALYEDGRPGAKAREGLVSEMVRLFAGSRRARARLYFDSDVPTRSEPSAQVVVLFSGGTGRDRADNAILADLERQAAVAAGTPRFVVSSDGDLVRQARELGATTMRSAEFAVLLGRPGR